MTLSLDITTKSKNTILKKKVKKNNMTTLQNKIDFVLVVDVENANPNGDPPYQEICHVPMLKAMVSLVM